MDLTDITDPDQSWKNAWALHSEMIVEHRDLNVRAFDIIVTVSYGVYNQLRPAELWKFRCRLEYGIFTKFCVLTICVFTKAVAAIT